MERERGGKSNSAIIDSQINSINNRIYLLCTALKCSVVSHFTLTFYAACCSSSCLLCLLDCCASLVGAWLLCQVREAHSETSQVRLLLPMWGLCVLLGMLPCLHGGLQHSHCWGHSALWTLTKEHASASPQPCGYCLLPLSVFTPMLWWNSHVTQLTWPSLGLCNSLWYYLKKFHKGSSGSRWQHRKILNSLPPKDNPSL